MLPIVEIDGRDYVVDLRRKEFRAMQEPKVSLTVADIDAKADDISFARLGVKGVKVMYVQAPSGRMVIDVANTGDGRRGFDAFPLPIRLQARGDLLTNPTADEVSKIDAAAKMAKDEQHAVWDDLLSRRADALVKEEEHYRREMSARLASMFRAPGIGSLTEQVRKRVRRRMGGP